MKNTFQLLDEQTALDLKSYLTRARKMDQKGSVRLRAFGALLTAYVAPLFTASILDDGPTVLGLRTMELKSEAEINILVPIQAVLDRLAFELERPVTEERFIFEMVSTERIPWAGVSPPRTGWVEAGFLSEELLTNTAKKGITEVAETIPESVGGPIAARIRAEVWGRAMDVESKVPAGAAFAAAGLGFLVKDQDVPVFHSQGWVRLSTEFGHVLSKEAKHF
ncbi:MAG: hypothetical protein RLZZ610_987 [Actinomycetota bacterium]|jgi:hypothetical protein